MIRRTQWDPLGDLFEDPLGAQAELDQMSQPLAHALGRHGQPRGAEGDAPAWMPALDISERKDAYLITVELPGVELDDVQITMEGNLLAIQGERIFAHESSEQQFHRIERRYGAFRRLITLPDHVMVDAVQATAGGGVLQILVPKAEEAKPKRIQVRLVDGLEPAASSPVAH
jgi:HSP20 family protein